jgi:hypothetical protein
MTMVFYQNWKNAQREFEIVKQTPPEAELVQWGNDMVVKYNSEVEE